MSNVTRSENPLAVPTRAMATAAALGPEKTVAKGRWLTRAPLCRPPDDCMMSGGRCRPPSCMLCLTRLRCVPINDWRAAFRQVAAVRSYSRCSGRTSDESSTSKEGSSVNRSVLSRLSGSGLRALCKSETAMVFRFWA